MSEMTIEEARKTVERLSSKYPELIDLNATSYHLPMLSAFEFLQAQAFLEGHAVGVKAGIKQERERAKWLVEVLRSIAKNTCCDKCQEASLVAKEALAKYEEGKR